MSLSTSSLARYRPAILAVTAIAAGCTIYYIHTSIRSARSSQPPPSQHTLHRSNAQRRNRLPRESDHSESDVTAERAPPGDAVTTEVGVSNQSLPLVHDAPDELRQALLRQGFLDGTGNAIDEAEQEPPEDALAPDANLTNSALPPADDESNALHRAIEERGTIADAESEHSWRDSTDSEDANKEGQSLLNLLYRIAEEQARKQGYVHRGISCNSCNTLPIRGIRYRCANCADVDLCETCESMQIHPKTHLFYKVRIPAPLLCNPKQPQPVWYPGKPTSVIQPLPKETVTKYCNETGFQDPEIEALWEQFRCLAATEWMDDPDHYHLAIDRPTFDKCFIPSTSLRPPPPNLIYDRLFAFYDTNRDGLIGFDEFLRGLSCLNKPKSDERRRKIFDGYDIDRDGYVDRKDFLRMFRAFYALSKEMAKEVVMSMDEDFYEGGGAREIITSSQPISSVFSGNIPPGERSRTGEGKMQDESGDYVMKDDGGIVRESGEDTGDHNEAVADAIEDSFAYSNVEDARSYRRYEESMLNEETHGEVWPPTYANAQDVLGALGALRVPIALEDVDDPDDREKVRRVAVERMQTIAKKRRRLRDFAVAQRWHRQEFYLDEEDGALPPIGFKQSETAETEPPSRRSRSSSKVRFQDDLTTDDDDHETRSATSVSSRSIPVGERWGGYEVPRPEKDVGREILYQVAQESLNELLDPVFRQREDLAILARRTKREREYFRAQLAAFVTDELRVRIKKELDEYEYEYRYRNLGYTHLRNDFWFAHLLERIKLDDTEPQASPAGRQSSTDGAPVSASAPLSLEENRQPISTSPVVAGATTQEPEGIHVPEELRILPDHPSNRSTSPTQLGQATSFPSFLDSESLTYYSAFDPTRESWETPYLESITRSPETTVDPPNLTEGPLDRNPNNGQALAPNQSMEFSPDPTLPQNRPNSVPASPPSMPSDAQGAPFTNSPLDSSQPERPSASVTREHLLYLAVIDMAEAQDNERGGPGRISYSEFEELSSGEKGTALGFVGQWVEMASF
ncbi:hypothetical protein MMC22_005832 [Lobaria immixta]|nr:hypothetical protein [Lobaria immixta]